MRSNNQKILPKISIAIPVYNEADNLGICLKAIRKQNYPKNQIEVIVVDNYSSDDSVEVAKKYRAKIYFNKIKDAQLSKMVAFKISSGEYFIYLDADIEIQGTDWIKKMIRPLMERTDVVASFTKFVSKKDDNALVRYLSYDTLQRDPIFEFATPSVESLIRERFENYSICYYSKNNIPPSGVCLYRKKKLLDIISKENDKFMELEVLVKLVEAGHTKFAYVENAGIHHPFLSGISELIKKRLRNIKRNYVGQKLERKYRWFNFRSLSGIIRALTWFIYANSIVFPTIRGAYKSIKYKDFACMYEPIVSFLETWVIVYGFLKFR